MFCEHLSSANMIAPKFSLKRQFDSEKKKKIAKKHVHL